MMDMYLAGQALHERFRDVGEFISKECYDNTFRNLHHFDDVYLGVVFCWVQVMPGENVYTRHACYLVEGEILDLTLYHNLRGFDARDGIKYYPFKILTVDEYLSAIHEGSSLDDTTGLFQVLHTEEKESREWMQKQGNIIIG